MIRYQCLIDLAISFLPGIVFRGQNLLLCKLLLFSDQISGRGGAEVSEGAPVDESDYQIL